MYKVYCRGRKNARWVEYSGEFFTLQEAENCKRIAEARRTCDIHGNLIMYKVKEEIKKNDNVIYQEQPIYIPLVHANCDKCTNQKMMWCNGCEHNFPSVDNFDFYREIKNESL
jgi:hypothetical protein